MPKNLGLKVLKGGFLGLKQGISSFRRVIKLGNRSFGS
jgi:hypothetical protein